VAAIMPPGFGRHGLNSVAADEALWRSPARSVLTEGPARDRERRYHHRIRFHRTSRGGTTVFDIPCWTSEWSEEPACARFVGADD